MANGNNGVRRPRRWLQLLLIVLGVLVLVGAYSSLKRKEVPVRADTAALGNITSSIATNGKVEALDNFEAHAPAPTTVRRVLVHPGDKVKAGQLLVQLEDFNARAEAAKAQASLKGAQSEIQNAQTGATTNTAQSDKARAEVESARRNLEALQRLQQTGAASAAEVQAAQTRLETAQADLRAVQQKANPQALQTDVARARAQEDEARAALSAAGEMLRDTNIRAPRAGTVYALPVRDGQYVQAGDLIVAVADLSRVRVRAFVDEPEIGKLTPGQRVNIAWDAIPGRIWQGELTRVPTSVTTVGARNVGEITTSVDNADLKLLPNVNVSVNVITAEHDNVVTVQREAVHQHGGANHVYEIVDGKLRQRDVKMGISNLTRIEITSGITPGITIALGSTTNQPLADGVAVKIVQR
jgi:HlyD family secretion protein